MSLNDSELYILQSLYGVLPKDAWEHLRESGKNPLCGYSEAQKRNTKRKFRKLKRKARVKKSDSAKVLWIKINRYLERMHSKNNKL
tara:strand:- start:2447 stop:2704 length:258 start_codon:yes stop_codon:yes gene_type:complete